MPPKPASAPAESGAPAAAATKLVVWDWKSGEPYAKTYIEKAKADFAKKHPNVTVEFVPQPFEQYYTLLGTAIQSETGPDVMLFNGGGQIRDRADSLLPSTSTSPKTSRAWPAGRPSPRTARPTAPR